MRPRSAVSPSVLAVALSVVSVITAVAAPASSSDTVVPGSVDNEVHINLSNSTRAPLLGLTARALEVPPGVLNLRIDPPRFDRVEEGDDAEFTVLFDVAPGTPEGELEPIRFEVAVEEGDFDTSFAELRLMVTAPPDLTVCVIGYDAPADFPPENAIDYCDRERRATEYDRVAVFFTPPRDVREPVQERQPFLWRVLGPNGGRQAVKGPTTWGPQLEESTPFAKEGSPGRFVAVLDLWERRDDPDPAEAHSGPGAYTVQTVAGQYDATGLLGQGESTVAIAALGKDDAGATVFAEWEEVKAFEVGSVRLHFQGFVMEQVKDEWWPDRQDVWEGKVTFADPQVNGTTVVVESDAWWRPAIRNGYGRFPAEDVLRARSRLTLAFPEQINPGHREMGEVGVRMEALERDKFFFTAGMHLLVPSDQVPRDRRLVEGGGPAPWAPGGAESPDICRGESFDGSWDRRYEIRYEGPVLGDEPAFDSGQVSWVWPRVPLAPTFCLVREASEASARTTLIAGERADLAGQPARSMPEHLGDPESYWIVPVFMSLTDAARPNARTLDMKVYGYAIYAPVPGTYAGQPPSTGPAVGDGPDDAPPADDDGADDVEGDDDEGDEGPPDAGDDTGGGAETGSNPDAGNPPDTGGEEGAGEGDTPVAGAETGDDGGPRGIVPSDPDVAALIREWIGVAEPPENATEGADLRYNHRGRKVGTVAGGVITHDEAANLPFDPTYLWVNFRSNDSVDHCTMEEYVVARVSGDTTDRCAGRYQRPPTVAVADVIGKPVTQAREELQQQGFVVDIQIVGGAPSRAQVHRVAEQRPDPATPARTGSSVQLGIYGDFVLAVTVPDLRNTAAADARTRLEGIGLVAEIVIGDEAPDAVRVYTVYEQSPGAGASTESGTTVNLTIYADYRPRVRVPYLAGISFDEAQRQLSALGLVAEQADGGQAPSAGSERQVASTDPEADTEVDRGTRVRVFLYGEFTHPSCAGLLRDGPAAAERGDLDGARQLLAQARDLDCPADWLDATIGSIDDRIRRRDRCNGLVAMGRQQEQAGDLQAALATYRQAVGEGCEVPGLGDAVARVEDAIRQADRDRRCSDLVTRGNELWNAGDLDGALASYRQALAEGCDNPGLDDGIATIEERIRERDRQNQQGARCDDLVTRGNQQLNGGDLEGALGFYRQARAEGCTNPGLDDVIVSTEQSIRNPDTTQPAGPHWILVETRINPERAPWEFVVGVTPDFYSARNNGSYRRWLVAENNLTFQSRWVDNGNLEMDMEVGVNFSSPPPQLVPGQTVNLRADFFQNGAVYSGNPGIRFEYRGEGIGLSGAPALAYFPWAPNFNGMTSTSVAFQVPQLHGGEIVLRAFLWNCSACNVAWVYRAQQAAPPPQRPAPPPQQPQPQPSLRGGDPASGPFWVVAGIYLPLGQEEMAGGNARSTIESRLGDISLWRPSWPLLLEFSGDSPRFYSASAFGQGSRWALPLSIQLAMNDGQSGSLNGALLLEVFGRYDSLASAHAAQPGVQQTGDAWQFRSADGHIAQQFSRTEGSSMLNGGPLQQGWSPGSQQAAQQLVRDLIVNFDFCFVATAVYEGHEHASVDRLRRFRDQVLLQSAAGRRLGALYYREGPRIARWVEAQPWLRLSLRPLFDLGAVALDRASRQPLARLALQELVHHLAMRFDTLPPDPGTGAALRAFRPWTLGPLRPSLDAIPPSTEEKHR